MDTLFSNFCFLVFNTQSTVKKKIRMHVRWGYFFVLGRFSFSSKTQNLYLEEIRTTTTKVWSKMLSMH